MTVSPVHVDHGRAVQKRDHQKFVGGFALPGLLGSGRASMLPLGTLCLGLWVIAVDRAFITCHQSIKTCRVWIDQLNYLPAIMTTYFFLIFSENPWDKPCVNLLHLQFLANNCVYSSHTDIKLCTYWLYRHTTVLIHEIHYLANQLWCSDFLIPPHHPSQTPCPPWIPYATENARFMQGTPKAVWIIPYVSVACFTSLKMILLHIVLLKCTYVQIAFFEIHLLWQPGFSRVYSNSCSNS